MKTVDIHKKVETVISTVLKKLKRRRDTDRHKRIYQYIFGEASCFEARSGGLRAGSAGGLGSAASSRSGVWGGAPAEIEFGAF